MAINATRSARPQLALTPLEARDVPSVAVAPTLTTRYAVGSGEGSVGQVNVYDAKSGAMVNILTPFGPQFTGGVRVATGDLTGDGVEDIVVAQASGGSAVKVFSGKTGLEVRGFDAFPGFKGGSHVAVGDVNGDKRADLVVGVGAGSTGSNVKVYDGKTLCPAGPITAAVLPAPVRTFNAFEPGFTGGVSVAAADVDGDGKAEVIAGAGAGNTPLVRVFSGHTGMTIQAFYANAVTFRGGVNVAAGDLDGDGKAEVIVGAGAGGGSEVQVFKNQRVVTAFRAYEIADRRGVRVAVQDLDGDGKAEILAGSGAGGAPRVRVIATDVPVTGRTVRQFPSFVPTFTGGVYVG